MSFLNKFSVSTRIAIMPVTFFIAISLLMGFEFYIRNDVMQTTVFPKMEEEIISGYKETLESAVGVQVFNIAKAIENVPERDEQIRIIENLTDDLRIFADKSGYFFTNQLDGTSINTPVDKASNGDNELELQDANGVFYMKEFIKTVRAGGGFVSYHYKKPGKGVIPKISYVKQIPGTQFFLGAGVYLDNVAEQRAVLQGDIGSAESGYNLIIIAAFLGAFLLVLSFSFFVGKSISVPVKEAVSSLRQGASQVESAAMQIAKTSQQMAEGASDQAGSLEETSSAVEEIAAMSRLSAENSSAANDMSCKTLETVLDSKKSMEKMIGTIDKIKSSSDETAKIIKTIDEIAFQTNLLALNAAVEAARAGEAGKGFAVVAEEVRNLASRSAEAARLTSDLIIQAQHNAQEGVAVTEEVNALLEEMVTGNERVSHLVGEVSSTNLEQSGGIDQINDALSTMDMAVQVNASNAIQSAAASQQLLSQSHELNLVVSNLVRIVSGDNQENNVVDEYDEDDEISEIERLMP